MKKFLAITLLALASSQALAVGSSLKPQTAPPADPNAKSAAQASTPGAPAKPAADVQKESAACRSTEGQCKAQCAKIPPPRPAMPGQPAAAPSGPTRDECNARCATELKQCLDAVNAKAGQ